ncbi:hypothetical protein PTI98_009015 [Pleurotus ostreatus]|nr:hypothetical protein PTI98_009015 [Pleurotus ostreatus]
MSGTLFDEAQVIFLANPSASNVHGRPDRGSTWLAVSSGDGESCVTIRREHGATFTVIMLYKEEAFATLEHVQSVEADIDIIFYDVGDYCSVYDLVEGTVICPRLQRSIQILARMVAVGDHTLKVYTEGPNPPPKELASLEIQQLRDTIDDALNTLQDEGSTPRGRRQAKIVAERSL